MADSEVNKANTVLQEYLVTSNVMIEEAICDGQTRLIFICNQ